MEERLFVVTEEAEGIRIDKYLSDCLPEHSRSFVQKLIRDGSVLIAEKTVKSNYKVAAGEAINIRLPQLQEPDILPEPIPLSVLYEDRDLIVVNKPKGMVVHPSAGHAAGTLVNALLYHCKEELSGINGIMRPGIVHRIDMDTTGSLIVCKNDRAHNSIAQQLKEHSITRRYQAIVHGVCKEDCGTIHTTIGRHPTERKKMAVNVKNGKDAVTHYKVLKRFATETYVECELETGRTHQIRVHMASIGHPLLGDQVYGNRKKDAQFQGQTLHAKLIGFQHPVSGVYMEFEAPLPAYFEELLAKLK